MKPKLLSKLKMIKFTKRMHAMVAYSLRQRKKVTKRSSQVNGKIDDELRKPTANRRFFSFEAGQQLHKLK